MQRVIYQNINQVWTTTLLPNFWKGKRSLQSDRNLPCIQSSLQSQITLKSTDLDSANKNNLESEKAIRKKCQRIIDYAFGDGPYPLSDITGLPDIVMEHIAQAIIYEQVHRKRKTEELEMEPSNNTKESSENEKSVIKEKPVISVDSEELSTQQTKQKAVDEIIQRDFKLAQSEKPIHIWRFWLEPEDKMLYFDPEKTEATAKEAPSKPDPTDMTEKSKTEQQPYEVEKTEEISKENHVKPGLDSIRSQDNAKNEYDTEKIESTVKKAKPEQELLHHFSETGLEMDLILDNLFKKDVAALERESKSPDQGLIDPKHSTNQPKISKKGKSLQPNYKNIKVIIHSIEIICVDTEPSMKNKKIPENMESDVNNRSLSKSDAKLLEHIEKFRVASPVSNCIMDINSTPNKSQDDQSLINAEWKLKKTAEAFTQEIVNRYTFKSTDDGLVHAQKMLTKATNEFCNKIKKDCKLSKIALQPYSADKPEEKKVDRLQTDSENKLEVAKVPPDVMQLDTKCNTRSNVVVISMSDTNRKSDIPFDTWETANTRNAVTKNMTVTTLGYKPYIRMKMPITKISDQSANKKRREKQSLGETITNSFVTTELRPKTKQIDHTLVLLNKVQALEEKSPDAGATVAKTKLLKDQAETECLSKNDTGVTINETLTPRLSSALSLKKYIPAQSTESINESITIVLKKPNTQKVNKHVALNLLKKLKVEGGIKEVQADLNKSKQPTQKNPHVIRPYCDNNWVQQFYKPRYNILIAKPPRKRAMSAEETANVVKNTPNSSGKFTPNCLQTVVPTLKTETNKSNISAKLSSHRMKYTMLSTKDSNLCGMRKTENNTISEPEEVLHYKAQQIKIVEQNHRCHDTTKKIKQTESRSNFDKASQVGEFEISLDKPKINLGKKVSLNPGSTKQQHSSPKNARTELEKMPLAVLLEIVRLRNQSKQARDAAMTSFGTKLFEGTPKSPGSNDSQKGRKDKRLYFPSYENEATKTSDAIKTKKQNQQDCKPEPEHPSVDKYVHVKDVFIKPLEILADNSEPLNSDGFVITKHRQDYELNSLKPKTESIQDTVVFARQFESWFPVKPIRSHLDINVEILPKNGFSAQLQVHIRDEQRRRTPSFLENLWNYFYFNNSFSKFI